MILFPNAKINIGLDIINRRSDGYHDISTVIVPVGWTDILELVPAAGCHTTLTVTGNHVDCPADKNLVMKAWRALENHIGHDLPPTDIFLHKIIPDGAGLGGGSADASFTLIGANRLWNLNLTDNQLAVIAATIGADCPIFIYNRPMLASGTGTTLSPIDIDISRLNVAIIKPAGSVSTAEAYSGVVPHTPAIPLISRLSAPIDTWRQTVANEFESSVGDRLPIIRDIKKSLYDLRAVYASMSGSGSAVYGLFDGDIPTDTLARLFPDMTIWTGKTV